VEYAVGYFVNDSYGDVIAQFSDIVRAALDGGRPDLTMMERNMSAELTAAPDCLR
jgi:hypothetical protein